MRQPLRQLKDHQQETRLFVNRSIWMMLFMGGLLGVIVIRLVYLQVINHAFYSTRSDENRVKIIPVAPTRGLIYDRNGVLLADNLPSYTLEITPEKVPDMEALLRQLAQHIRIRDIDLRRFRKALRRKRKFDQIPLRFRLTDVEVARIAAIQHRLPGTHIEARLTRRYFYPHAIAHLVGYVGRIDERDLARVDVTNYRASTHIGKTGIERQYENLLHGVVGYQQVETNAQGRILRVLKDSPPVPGLSLFLSIDIRLQKAAMRALGDYNGAVVAIDPNTGEILALASKPAFDPNLFVNGIGIREYAALRNDKSRPLFNRTTLGQYPPGSTLKPFIGLAGLYYNVVDHKHSLFCPGYYKLPNEDRKFRDWKKTGHGKVNLDASITQSCDVYFYDLALKLGIDRIAPFMARFGFGRKTGIDLPVEKSGINPSRAWKRLTRHRPWFPGETLNTGIGQGYTTATPLQLAQATAILAMRGKGYRPHVVRATRDPVSDEITPVRQIPLKPITDVRAHDWRYIIESMRHVVSSARGTAHRIDNPRYTIAGKTGTAQVFGIKQEEEYDESKIARKLRDHALFIAFAPVDKPQIAIAVIVENGGSGGRVAAPIARRILDAWMQTRTPATTNRKGTTP